MSKYKIEIELNVDFQKFFDNIPEGLYKSPSEFDESYELEAIHKVLHQVYVNALVNKTAWMTKPEYPYAEHHILIEEEISRQISEKAKIQKVIE